MHKLNFQIMKRWTISEVPQALKARFKNTEITMTFRSKFDSRAGVVAVAALISGVLAGPAFAQVGGPPHAPYLTRSAPQKTQALRPGVGSMAVGAASTQSDIAAEPFPAAPSGRAKSRARIFAGGYRGGPPR